MKKMKKKLTILAIALLSINLLQAQCVAVFSSTVSPANDGVVSFTPTFPSNTYSYFWSFGDGSSGFQQNATHTYNTGTFTVCLTITDSINSFTCTLCDTINVVNNTTPTCGAAFQVYLDSAGVAQFLDYSTGTNLTYVWNFGDNSVGTTAGNCTHNYNSPGLYYVCLTISNSSTGCSDNFCDSLYIPYTSSCTASMSFIVDSTGTGVSYSSTVSGSADTYFWSFGDGTFGYTANPYHLYANIGTYNVCLTASSSTDSTCSYTTCQTVSISNPTSGCNANFIIIQDSLNLYNYWVFNYASGNGSAITSYLWDFGDGTSSTSAYPQHTYTGTGPYYICLTIVSGNLMTCTATYCDSIYPGLAPTQNTTITVLNPLTVGVQNQNSIVESLENYPNPFTNSTIVSYSIKQNSNIELSVLDLLGNKVATLENGLKSSGNYKTTFDASSISAGIYLLQLKTDGKVTTKKLVVEK